ncbi:hypothetical protein SDC9_40876 [bioreactor metagenome]|uniref:Polysaccharide pyruvyl transferase domain-containing protein n=1 Tax=bioreactor metagenome TaxID=1076179 RepID=A0A644VTK0_9ZZZZ
MKKKIKIGIAGIDLLSGNRGVGALAYSTIYILNNIAKKYDFDIKITIISDTYGEFSLKFENEIIDTKSILNVSIFSFKDIFKLFTNLRLLKSLKDFFSFDYILSMGIGDSFSDIYGNVRFDYINSQHKIARFLNKKYALLPQTIGPFEDDKIKNQAQKSIEKANLVFARDFQSFDYVKKNTKQKNIFEAIDVAFFMPYEKQKFQDDSIHVGINISALLWHGGYTRNNQFGLKANYQKLVYSIIEYFLALPDIKIHIVPHVVLQNSNVENDYETSYELVNKYHSDKIILAPFFLTPIIAKNYISGLDFFIGARMHATIAAFSSGVPVFPLAYSRKFNGLFKDTLNYNYMADMVDEKQEEILSQMKIAFINRNELKNIIKERMNSVVKRKEKLLIEKLTEVLGLTSKKNL